MKPKRKTKNSGNVETGNHLRYPCLALIIANIIAFLIGGIVSVLVGEMIMSFTGLSSDPLIGFVYLWTIPASAIASLILFPIISSMRSKFDIIINLLWSLAIVAIGNCMFFLALS